MDSSSITGSMLAVAIVLVIALFVYFFPSLIATHRQHHNSGSIFVINLFLGWTFIGWVVALAMACGAVHRPITTQ